jgi:Cu+-exporting ATPase
MEEENTQIKEQELRVEGMTCTACVASIRKYLESEGAQQVFVDLNNNKVTFQYIEGQQDVETFTRGIERIGYKVVSEDHKSRFPIKLKVWITAFLTAPLLVDHILHLFGYGIPGLHNPWVHFGFTLPVYLIGIQHFGKSAWAALRNGDTNMDVLIFMGSSTAFFYSCAGLYLQDPRYNFFETAAMIITLVLVGNLLESRALSTTSGALDELEKLKSETARLSLGNQQYMDIPADEVRKGDHILIRTGEAIPADGKILEGIAETNESILTGEAIPLSKKVGDDVWSGTLVTSGNIVIQASVDAVDTLFNRIIKMVKTAQSDRPPIQRLADKISSWFVPTVIFISIGTYFLGYYVLDVGMGQSLMNAIAVLVISCPCAMGLATPTAITVGMGRMTKTGLLVKGATTIERIAGLKHLLFDKTGTLTTGELKVRQIRPKMGKDAEVRQVLYQMESYSTHPLAKAILKYLGNPRIASEMKLQDIREIPGIGLEATGIDGKKYKLGRDDVDEKEGYHLGLWADGEKWGHIHLEDELRPDAKAVIDTLKRMNYQISIVSGDREDNVKRVADLTGIEQYYSAQLPQDKYALIERERDKQPTAMIGDGINDAPALERANVGIAMAGASATSLQSANAALMKPDLNGLVALLALSRLTVKTIKENLFWAFSYNIVAIPLAVLGFLNPMWGALFMAFSDLVVIGNSIRLKRRRY